MFDYNRMSTERLEALRQRKWMQIRRIEDQEYILREDRREIDKLVIELRHINAVLTARQNTLRMEGF